MKPLIKLLTPPLEYAWMSSAVYKTLTQSNIAATHAHHQKLLQRGWRLEYFIEGQFKKNIYQESGYQGGIYVHEQRKEIVIAHAGTSLERFQTVEADWRAVVQQEIHPQVTDALDNTLKESVQSLLKNHYQLTFTGHSLGGFLAALSLYFCQRSDLKYHFPHAKAVVFDSAGSQDFMIKSEPHAINNTGIKTEGIANLNISHFLSYPNYINAFRPHPGGTIYALLSPSINSAIQEKKNNPAGYLKLTHTLDNFLCAFDEKTGYPFPEYCRIATDWPLVDLKDLEELTTSIGRIKFLASCANSLFQQLTSHEKKEISAWGKLWGGAEFQHAAWQTMHQGLETSHNDFRSTLQSRRIFLPVDYRYTLRLCHFNNSSRNFLKDLIFFKNMPLLLRKFFEEHSFSKEETNILLQVIVKDDYVTLPSTFQKNIFDLRELLLQLEKEKGLLAFQLRDFMHKQVDEITDQVDELKENEAQNKERLQALEQWKKNAHFSKKINSFLTLPKHYVSTHYENTLAQQLSAQVESVKYLAICGITGSGKSTLARHFLKSAQQENIKNLSVVLDAQSPHAWEASLRALAKNIDNESYTEMSAVIQAIKSYLIKAPWNIVVDNWEETAVHIDTIRDIFGVGEGVCLITTQHRSPFPDKKCFLYLDAGLSIQESQDMWEKIFASYKEQKIIPGTQQEQNRLSQTLGCLPLALEQAACYILCENIEQLENGQLPNFTYAKYSDILKNNYTLLIEKHKNVFAGKADVPKMTQEAAVYLSLQKILGNNSPKNNQLLSWLFFCFCGFLANNSIPPSLLKSYVNQFSKDADSADANYRTLLKTAKKYSLLTPENTRSVIDNEYMLVMHGAVKKVILDNYWPILSPYQVWINLYFKLPLLSLPQMIARATLTVFTKALERNHWNEIKEYYPHLEAIWSSYPKNTKEPLYFRQIRQLSWANYLLGDTNSALLYAQKLLSEMSEYYGPESLSVIETQMNIANLLKIIGDYEGAKKHCNEVLEKFELPHKLLEKDKQNGIADINILLGNILQKQGKYTEAQACYNQAKNITEKIYGIEHFKIAAIEYELFQLFQEMGENKKAMIAFDKSSTFLENISPDNGNYVVYQENRASFFLEQKELPAEAEAIYRHVLSYKIRHYGENHISVARTEYNLAQCLLHQERYQEAKDLYEEALRIQNDNNGSKNDTAMMQRGLATACMYLNQLEQAKKFCKRALATQIPCYSENSFIVTETQKLYAKILMQMGKLKEAEGIFLQVLKAQEHIYHNTPNIHIAQTKEDLAEVWIRQERYQEMKESYKEILKIKIAHYTNKHLQVALTYHRLSYLHNKLGEFSEARTTFAEYERIKKDLDGSGMSASFANSVSHFSVFAQNKKDETPHKSEDSSPASSPPGKK